MSRPRAADVSCVRGLDEEIAELNERLYRLMDERKRLITKLAEAHGDYAVAVALGMQQPAVRMIRIRYREQGIGHEAR